jgi:lipopolysaccharide biosynthesis protein
LLADRGEMVVQEGEKGEEGQGKEEREESEARREHPTPRGRGSGAFLHNVRALLKDETFLLLSAAGGIRFGAGFVWAGYAFFVCSPPF